jgi:hypothetical protein
MADLISSAGGAGAGALVALSIREVFAWLRARPKGAASVIEAQAAYQNALNEQVKAFTASILAMANDLREDIARLENEVFDLQKAKRKLEDENLHCRGENRQLRAILAGLTRHLRKAGIDIPLDLQVTALLEVGTEDGGVTAITPLEMRKAAP